MQQAREASAAWSSVPLAARLEKLAALRLLIVSRREEILLAITQDAGKVRTEALLTDLLPTLEILRFNERQAPRILRPDPAHCSLPGAGPRSATTPMARC